MRGESKEKEEQNKGIEGKGKVNVDFCNALS